MSIVIRYGKSHCLPHTLSSNLSRKTAPYTQASNCKCSKQISRAGIGGLGQIPAKPYFSPSVGMEKSTLIRVCRLEIGLLLCVRNVQCGQSSGSSALGLILRLVLKTPESTALVPPTASVVILSAAATWTTLSALPPHTAHSINTMPTLSCARTLVSSCPSLRATYPHRPTLVSVSYTHLTLPTILLV